MRRARFRDPAGSVRVGEWTDDAVRAAGRTYDREDVDVLAPTEPSKVIGIGLNYESTVDEDLADPLLFWKGGSNVVASHGSTVELPDGEVIYEAELGVVVGEQCRNATAGEAERAIAGYTCANDVTNQTYADAETFLRRKSFDGAAPMGPCVADPDEVPENPRARLWVNGELRQDSAGDPFHRSPAEVVEHVSAHLTLEPGDVVLMSTTGDWGPLAGGDGVRIEIEGVGTLEHDVRA